MAIDAGALGLTKIDLGGEWHALTGLPFVYAMWTGRQGVVSPAHCSALRQAREQGGANLARIAAPVGGGDADRTDRALRYLRDNLKYGLGEREAAGLRRFHELAVDLGLAPALKPLNFYS